MRKFSILATLLLATGTLFAQKDSIGAIIQVENDYAPVVVKATKMSFTPQIEIPKDYTPLDLVFSQEGEPFKRFIAQRNIKEVLPTQEASLPGYARAAYGTGGNVDLKAAYRFNISERDNVNIFASLDGYNTTIDQDETEWDSRFYTTWINADYTHKFDKLSLGIDANILKKVYNYNTIAPLPGYTNKQNTGSYALGVNAKSHTMGAFSYNAYARFTMNSRNYSMATDESIAENRFSVGGNVRYELPYENVRSIATNIDVDGFLYNSGLKPAEGPGIHDQYKDYALIRVNPYTTMRFGDWRAHLGLHADFVTAGAPFAAIAPDLKIEGPLANGITAYASAIGGRRANSFEIIEQLSPYWDYIPGTRQFTTSYNVCDISAGIRTSYNALSTNIYAGFSYTIDDLMPSVAARSNIYTDFVQAGSRDIYVGVLAAYDYDGWLDIEANLRYDKQGCSKNDALLMYKPMLTAGLNARARIIEGLYANISYTFTSYTEGNEGEQIEDKSNLEARVSYRLHEQINLFVQGSNLLNSEHQVYPGYVAQGVNAMIGASFNF